MALYGSYDSNNISKRFWNVSRFFKIMCGIKFILLTLNSSLSKIFLISWARDSEFDVYPWSLEDADGSSKYKLFWYWLNNLNYRTNYNIILEVLFSRCFLRRPRTIFDHWQCFPKSVGCTYIFFMTVSGDLGKAMFSLVSPSTWYSGLKFLLVSPL